MSVNGFYVTALFHNKQFEIDISRQMDKRLIHFSKYLQFTRKNEAQAYQFSETGILIPVCFTYIFAKKFDLGILTGAFEFTETCRKILYLSVLRTQTQTFMIILKPILLADNSPFYSCLSFFFFKKRREVNDENERAKFTR